MIPRGVSVALLRLFAAILTLALAASQAPAQPVADATANQILVMLRLPTQHFRPGLGYASNYGDAVSHSALERTARRISHDYGLTLVGDWPMPLLHIDCFILATPPGKSVEESAAQVSRDPAVEWSQPVHTYRTQGPSAPKADPLAAAQPAMERWRLNALHRVFTGRGVTVAVIDSRIEVRHPDLAGQVGTVEDFVPEHPSPPEQHGTAVAGIIAAKADDGKGIVGVAPAARLMGLRACWQLPGGDTTLCDSLSLAKALHFAIEHDARVLNLSLSGPSDRLLARLVQLAQSRGDEVVAAFDPTLPAGGFPASAPGVVAVSDGLVAALPAKVYLAPGRDILTTEPGGTWYLVNGSSYAAAHVSGLLALLREGRPKNGPEPRLVGMRANPREIDACATLSVAGRQCPCECGDHAAQVAALRRP